TIPLRAGLARSRRVNEDLNVAETALRELVERETAKRADELELTLARARADSSSRLAEEDRKLADARLSELNQRERRLAAELGETEAVRRIQSGFADVERRQIDQLSRIVDRTANRLSEAAVEQFSTTVKAAREDAAKRLSRELDRAVAQFAHDAQSVLAERLAQV